MNRHSIIFKVTIAFALSFTILFLLFIVSRHMMLRAQRFRFRRLALIYLRSGKIISGKNIDRTISVINPGEANFILNNGEILNRRRHILNRPAIPPIGHPVITFIRFNGGIYAYARTKNGIFMIEDTGGFPGRNILLFSWIGLNIILAFLYISIYRSIRPLGGLRKKMEDFKQGDMDIDLEYYVNRKDETGFIAREFENAVNNIKKNLNTRVWFIRNIAHELKTPITRGKIALELLNEADNDKKVIFSSIFNRLETLINQLLVVEKISISDTNLNFSSCKLSDIIEKAKSLLFSDDSTIEFESDDDYYVKADCELLTTAAKNIMDNGIKFGEGNKVAIKINKGIMSFISVGGKPAVSNDMIFEPFMKDPSLKNKTGFGLGLYITKQILEKHGLNINYRHEEGSNIFYIDFNKLIA